MSSGQNITSPAISGKPAGRSTDLIVVFTLDEPKYALPMTVVERIIRAVEITEIPNAPAVIKGAVNVQGNIMPVVNLRHRLHLPDREVGLNDRFIITHTQNRKIVLVTDGVTGIFAPEYGMTDHEGENFPQVEYVKGLTRTGNDIILIYDLDTLLSLDEEKQLDNALMAGI